jgi:hypothetical protein
MSNEHRTSQGHRYTLNGPGNYSENNYTIWVCEPYPYNRNAGLELTATELDSFIESVQELRKGKS